MRDAFEEYGAVIVESIACVAIIAVIFKVAMPVLRHAAEIVAAYFCN